LVLGAAQYDGDPSPVFAGRLEHAQLLYDEGRSDTIVVLGGGAPGDRTTEAEAGRDWLVAPGGPPEAGGGVPGGVAPLESPGAPAGDGVGVPRLGPLAQPAGQADGVGSRSRGVRIGDVALGGTDRGDAGGRLPARDARGHLLPPVRALSGRVRPPSSPSASPASRAIGGTDRSAGTCPARGRSWWSRGGGARA